MIHDPLRGLSADWRSRRQSVTMLAEWDAMSVGELADRLVELMQTHNQDLSTLNGAVQVLARLGSEVIPRLQPLLSHPNVEVRMAAAVVLSQLPDRLGTPLLLEMLRDEDVNVRYHAVEGLGQQGVREAVPALLELLAEGDFFLAFAAVEALARIGDRAALPELCGLLTSEDLRFAATEALTKLPHPVALPSLLTALEQGLSPSAAVPALDAIGLEVRHEQDWRALVSRHVKPDAVRALLATEPSPALMRVLSWMPPWPEVSERLRELLALGLGSALAERESSPLELLRFALRHEHPKIRLGAAEKLARHKVGLALQPLLQLLQEPDSSLVARAARALGQLGNAESLPALLEQLGHPHALVRQAVVGAALELEFYPEELEKALRSDRPSQRSAAVRWFGHQHGAMILDRLLHIVREDQDPRVRCEALEALARRGAEVPGLVGPLLKERLARGNSAEKATASRLLALLAPAEAAPLLETALHSADLWVLIYACRSAASLALTGSLPRLRDLLADGRPPVRAEAARALVRIAPDQAEETLPLLEDCDPNVAVALLEVLPASEGLAQRLLALSESSHQPLRRAALSALGRGPRHPEVEERLSSALTRPEDRGAALDALLASGELWAERIVLRHFAGLGAEQGRAAASLGERATVWEEPETLDLSVRRALAENVRDARRLALLLDDADVWVRRQAVLSLCDPVPPDDQRPSLQELADYDRDSGMRLLARMALDL